MQKRPRSVAASPSQDPTATPPLHQALLAFHRSPLPAGHSARTLLASLAASEVGGLVAAGGARSAALSRAFSSAQQLEGARAAAAAAVVGEAVGAARRAAEAEVGARVAAGAPWGEAAAGEGGAAAAEAAAGALREYGLTSADAAAAGAVARGEGGGAPPLPPPAPVAEVSRPFAGRPLRGATSAALYLGAEWEVGFPPPRRDAWRFPLSANAAAAAMDPHLVANAREALKRPGWPDRAYGVAASGGGAPELRALALASQFDDAAAVGEAVAGLHERALRGLAKL
jgi:hypothetical protein